MIDSFNNSQMKRHQSPCGSIMRSTPWVVCCFLLLATTNVSAKYTETMDPGGLTKNLVSDYGLVDDNATANQSSKLQKAINDIAAVGGGRLILPRGTYRLANVYLKSNVHLLIEKDTVIKPVWPEGTKTVVFLMDAEPPTNRKGAKNREREFIENVSIRGLGGRFIVDYSDRQRREGEGIRAVLCRMVKNFLISDLDVKDNFTVYCGVTMTPTRTKTRNVEDWEVSRATDGTMRNCRIFNASPGYGLVQLHGAQSLHFEDLYARGGVTLRLETGAVGEHTAVYDITGKNILCENGRCGVMLGPHSAVNGVVRVDGVRTTSCTHAVQAGMGGVKESELERNPNAKPGSFAEGTSIRNIHAIFGMQAQIKKHSMLDIPEEYYDDLKLWDDDKFFTGPSIGAVKDATEGNYEVIIENVTQQGFTHNVHKPILTPQDTRPGRWAQVFKKWKSERGIE